MAEQREHPLNRHLFIADNLNLLRALDNESIDLICIDPPFAKNQTFTGSLRPPLSEAERQQELETLAGWGIRSQRDAENAGIEWPEADNTGRFSDIWRWEDDVHEDWVTRIENDFPTLSKVIDTTRTAHSEGTAAYLTFMAIRIIELHRILKPNGSMYLHCDSAANSYLRLTMDAIFGTENFKTEIVWQRTTSHSDAKRLGRVHDYILFYGKGPVPTWNSVYQPLNPGYVENYYRYKDDDGRRFMSADLSGAGPGPERTFGERGTIAPPTGRHWMYDDDGIVKLLAEDKIYWTRNGVPRLKVYLDQHPGMPAHDVWADIQPLRSWHKERTGYPTQKPAALAERIIKASSNPGDVVLDCFAGCAYVPIAAERNGRQWIACDISPRALTVLRRQFAKFNYAVDGEQQTDKPRMLINADITTKGPGELPDRSDEDLVEWQDIKELPERKFKVPASRIPEREMLEFLLEISGYTAWCCGFANRRSNGEVVRTARNFHLDHIDPKSKQGSNQIMNRAPLCPHHNIRKNNRRVHLEDYRAEIADAGEMLVDTTGELIDLAWAYEQALGYYTLKTAPLFYRSGG
ncbi:MAG: DNA methyltransferase [Chloroflexota bacterium]|nr:DNA methyltransferase [Chloroflexota bacterium]